MSFERVFGGSKVDPSFYDVYEVVDVLDPAVFPEDEEALAELRGTVSTAHKINDADKKLFVVKSVFKANMVKERVKRECNINFKIRHQNITRVHEIFESDEEVILIMDYMEGGDLFDRVARAPNCRLLESDVHRYMHQLADVIVYLHDMDIAHRDLKPENVMFETKEDSSRLCVLDFGFAKHTDETLETPIGTLQYLAPEVLQPGSYDKSVDIWSLGCVLFFMLFGRTPFLATSDEAIVARAAEVEFHFPEDIAVSDGAKDLISRLLRKNPAERLTASEILTHKWMAHGPTQSPLSTSTELATSSQSTLSQLRASINHAIDHARQEAEDLAAAVQKSPRATASSNSTEHQKSPRSPLGKSLPKMVALGDSPAYRKRTVQNDNRNVPANAPVASSSAGAPPQPKTD